jgi:transcriptional regulator with XRE-family HTH domain
LPSQLGKLIRKTRQGKSLSLRELARRINKSAAYVVSLELSDDTPGATEDTLAAIAEALELNSDVLLSLARKTPEELTPRSPTQMALYRLIKDLPTHRQELLKKQLENELRSHRRQKRDAEEHDSH